METVDLGLPHITVLETIGRGGFSVVYKALDTKLNRHVAVKVLTAVGDQADVDRFELECQIHGPLSSHPNIVTIHDAGHTPAGNPFLVMEYLDAGSLTDYLQANGSMGWQQAINFMAPICDAVDTAHRMGVLHRDIKPANILISADGPKLADFGIACVSDATSPQFAVSWFHAPPEAEKNRRDERSDVYSLASTLFQLLTGRAPFARDGEDSLASLLHRIVEEPAPQLPPNLVPSWLNDVLQRALAKDPAHRPPTAAAFGAALSGSHLQMGQTTVLPSPAVVPQPATLAAPVVAASTPLVQSRDNSHEPIPITRPLAAVNHPGPVQHNPIQHSPVQHSPIQHIPVQHGVTNHSVTHHSVPLQAAPYQAQQVPARRSKKLPVAVAVAALTLVGFFLSPAWAAIAPGGGDGSANSATDAAQEPEQAETTTTSSQASTTATTAVEPASPSTSETTENSTETSETTDTSTGTETTETTEDTGTTTSETTDTTPPPPPPPVEVEIPNVVGRSEAQAIDDLEAEGFTNVSRIRVASSSVDEGDVISTDPAAGSEVELDTPITVTVSDGPELVEVPSLVGLDQDAAIAEAEAAGLSPVVVTVPVDADSPRVGRVISQDLAAASDVASGSTITISVGKAEVVVTTPEIIAPPGGGIITTTTTPELSPVTVP